MLFAFIFKTFLIAQEKELNKVWELEYYEWKVGFIEINNEKVYLATNGGRQIDEIKLSTGKLLKSFKIEETVNSGPVVDNNHIVFSTNNFKVQCVDKNNSNLLWTFNASGAVSGVPLIYKDTVVAGTMNGMLYGISRDTGKSKWQRKIGWWNKYIGAYKNTILLCTGHRDQGLHLIDVKSGKTKWSYSNLKGLSFAIDKGLIFYGNVAIRFSDGEILWKIKENVRHWVVNNDGAIGQVGYDKIICVNRFTGKLKWEYKLKIPPKADVHFSGLRHSTVAVKGRVYLVTEIGKLIVLNSSNGKELQTKSVYFGAQYGVSLSKGFLLTGKFGGELVCLKIKDTTAQWNGLGSGSYRVGNSNCKDDEVIYKELKKMKPYFLKSSKAIKLWESVISNKNDNEKPEILSLIIRKFPKSFECEKAKNLLNSLFATVHLNMVFFNLPKNGRYGYAAPDLTKEVELFLNNKIKITLPVKNEKTPQEIYELYDDTFYGARADAVKKLSKLKSKDSFEFLNYIVKNDPCRFIRAFAKRCLSR